MTEGSRGRGAAARRAVAAALVLALLNGCAVGGEVRKMAHDAFDPGVHGTKPLTAAEAAQLGDDEITRRLDFVTRSLDDHRTHGAWWYYGFLTVNAVGTIAGAATAAVEDNEDDQIYSILNSSLGLIGTGYMLAAPLPGRSGADPVRVMPSETHDDRAAQLAEAEDILYGAAGRAKQRTGWLLHTGNVVLNASAASVLLARESYGNAALLFFLNAAIGEAQILLTPWQPLTSWEEYQALIASGGVPPDPRARWGVGPLPGGQGLALRAQF